MGQTQSAKIIMQSVELLPYIKHDIEICLTRDITWYLSSKKLPTRWNMALYQYSDYIPVTITSNSKNDVQGELVYQGVVYRFCYC